MIFEHNEHQVEEARELSEEVDLKNLYQKDRSFLFNNETNKERRTSSNNRKGSETQLLQQPKEVKYQNKALDKIKEITDKHGSFRKVF